MAESEPPSTRTISSTQLEEARRQLAEFGVAVFPDVLTPEFCDACVGEYKLWLRNFGTGGPDNINSIIHKYGCAHMNATWRVRLAVKSVFAALWDTDKLLTSFDGIAISKPPEQEQRSGRRFHKEGVERSLHLDQGPHRVGLHAYQGAVYLESADEDDWCFQVLAGSHNHFEEFHETFPSKLPSEFRKLNAAEIQWCLDHDCQHRRVPVSKGGVLVWDSRLVHDGAKPKHGRAHPDRWRFVNFVSMTPAIWATPEDYKIKRVAMEGIRPTRHWSSRGSSMFRKCPSYPGLDLEELPEIAKTDDVSRLAGLVKYDFGDGENNGPGYTPVMK